MLDYLLKSGACLAIFLLFYKLFLEQENMHMFKRYYLLAVLVLSFVIPSIVFTKYVEVEPMVNIISTPTQIDQAYITEQAQPVSDSDMVNLPLVLWSLYSLGLLLFGYKFLKNLRLIFQRIRKNPKYKINSITNVLLNELITPHTFFSFIFLNKMKFETKQIPDAVLLHEKTHAKQKHSFDVLFVELLQVIFWFNPLIYLTKHCIKLNHEFLADQAVVKNGMETATYQNILLAFSSNASTPQFSNSINYSSIKKRFTVMKKRTSKKSVLFRSILALPLLAILLLGFSQKKILEIPSDNTQISACADAKHLTITLYENELQIDGRKFSDSINWLDYLRYKYVDNTKNKNIPKLHFILINENNVDNSLGEILSAFSGGFWRIHEATDKTIINNNNIIEILEGVSVPQANKYNRLARKYNPVSIEKRVIPIKDLKDLESIYGRMTDSQKQNAQPFPECLPTQEGISKALMKEYNKLAKHYNDMPHNKMKILKKDVDRLEYIYALMSDKQKADAEPFPDFPEPPPPPNAPKAPNEREEAAAIIKKIIEEQDPHDIVTANSAPNSTSLKPFYTDIDFKKMEKSKRAQFENEEALMIKQEKLLRVEKIKLMELEEKMIEQEVLMQEKVTEMQELETSFEQVEKKMRKIIESPPVPKSPLDHVIEMAKKDAKFYYEGKEISSDKAIEILKKNKNINVDSRGATNGKSTVKLSKEPIQIDIKGQGSIQKTEHNGLAYAMELASKNAQFYFNNKKITSREGIALIKTKKDLSIETLPWTSKQPEVKIYDKAIYEKAQEAKQAVKKI